MQRFFIVLGVLLILLGILWPYLAKLPVGKLPGDIVIQKGRFSFYFPIVTSILLSLLLTLLLNLFLRRL